MNRDAAHRDRLAPVRASLGQGDVETCGRHLGVVEEQLEEIAHAVEKQGIPGLLLEAAVLGHHRGWGVGAGHASDYPCSSFPRKRESRFLNHFCGKPAGPPAFAGVTK